MVQTLENMREKNNGNFWTKKKGVIGTISQPHFSELVHTISLLQWPFHHAFQFQPMARQLWNNQGIVISYMLTNLGKRQACKN